MVPSSKEDDGIMSFVFISNPCIVKYCIVYLGVERRGMQGYFKPVIPQPCSHEPVAALSGSASRTRAARYINAISCRVQLQFIKRRGIRKIRTECMNWRIMSLDTRYRTLECKAIVRREIRLIRT